MLTTRLRIDKVKQWVNQNCNTDLFNMATVYDEVEGVSVQDCKNCSFSSIDNSSALFVSVSQIYAANQNNPNCVEAINNQVKNEDNAPKLMGNLSNRPGNLNGVESLEKNGGECLDKTVAGIESLKITPGKEEEYPKKNIKKSLKAAEKEERYLENDSGKEELSEKCFEEEESSKRSLKKKKGPEKYYGEEELSEKCFAEEELSKRSLKKKKGSKKYSGEEEFSEKCFEEEELSKRGLKKKKVCPKKRSQVGRGSQKKSNKAEFSKDYLGEGDGCLERSSQIEEEISNKKSQGQKGISNRLPGRARRGKISPKTDFLEENLRKTQEKEGFSKKVPGRKIRVKGCTKEDSGGEGSSKRNFDEVEMKERNFEEGSSKECLEKDPKDSLKYEQSSNKLGNRKSLINKKRRANSPKSYDKSLNKRECFNEEMGNEQSVRDIGREYSPLKSDSSSQEKDTSKTLEDSNGKEISVEDRNNTQGLKVYKNKKKPSWKKFIRTPCPSTWSVGSGGNFKKGRRKRIIQTPASRYFKDLNEFIKNLDLGGQRKSNSARKRDRRRGNDEMEEDSGEIFVGNTTPPQENLSLGENPVEEQEIMEEEDYSSDTDWDNGKNIDLQQVFVKNRQRFRAKYIDNLQKTQIKSMESKENVTKERKRRRLLNCHSIWDKDNECKEEFEIGKGLQNEFEFEDDPEYNFERFTDGCGKILDDLVGQRMADNGDTRKKKKLKDSEGRSEGKADNRKFVEKKYMGGENNKENMKKSQEEGSEVGENVKIQVIDQDFGRNLNFRLEDRIIQNNFEIRMSGGAVFEEELNRPSMDGDGYVSGINFIQATDERDNDENHCKVLVENLKIVDDEDLVLNKPVQCNEIFQSNVNLHSDNAPVSTAVVQCDKVIPVIVNELVESDSNIKEGTENVQSDRIISSYDNVQPDNNIHETLYKVERIVFKTVDKDIQVQSKDNNTQMIFPETEQADMVLTGSVQCDNIEKRATNALNDTEMGDVDKNTTNIEKNHESHNDGEFENCRKNPSASRREDGKSKARICVNECGVKTVDVDCVGKTNKNAVEEAAVTNKKNRIFVTKSKNNSKQEKFLSKYVAKLKNVRKYKRLKVKVIKNENVNKNSDNLREFSGRIVENKKFNMTNFYSKSVSCSSGWSDIDERLKQINCFNKLKVVRSDKNSENGGKRQVNVRRGGLKEGGRIKSAEENNGGKMIGRKRKNQSKLNEICEGEPERKLSKKGLTSNKEQGSRINKDNKGRGKENIAKGIVDDSVMRNNMIDESNEQRDVSKRDENDGNCQMSGKNSHKNVIVVGSNQNNDDKASEDEIGLNNKSFEKQYKQGNGQTGGIKSTVMNDKLEGINPKSITKDNNCVVNNEEIQNSIMNNLEIDANIQTIEESLNFVAEEKIDNNIELVRDSLNLETPKNLNNVAIIEGSLDLREKLDENIEIIQEILNFVAPEDENIEKIHSSLNFEAAIIKNRHVQLIDSSLNVRATENVEIIADSTNFEAPEIVGSGDWFIENSAPLENETSLFPELRCNLKTFSNLGDKSLVDKKGSECESHEGVITFENVPEKSNIIERNHEKSKIYEEGKNSGRSFATNNDRTISKKLKRNTDNELGNNFEVNDSHQTHDNNDLTKHNNETDMEESEQEMDKNLEQINSSALNEKNETKNKYETENIYGINNNTDNTYRKNSRYERNNNYETSNRFLTSDIIETSSKNQTSNKCSTENDYDRLLQEDEEFFTSENLMTIDSLTNMEGDVVFTELEIQIEGELIEDFCDMLQELEDDRRFDRNLLKSFIKQLRGASVRCVGFDTNGNILVDGVRIVAKSQENQSFDHLCSEDVGNWEGDGKIVDEYVGGNEAGVDECQEEKSGGKMDKYLQTNIQQELGSNAYTSPLNSKNLSGQCEGRPDKYVQYEEGIKKVERRIDNVKKTQSQQERLISNSYIRTHSKINSENSVPLNVSSGNLASNSIILNSTTSSDRARVLSLLRSSMLSESYQSVSSSKSVSNNVQGVPFVFRGVLSTRVLGELSRIKMLRHLN